MYSAACPDCFENFSRRDVMLRHRHNKQLGDKKSEAYPQRSEAYPPPPQGVIQLPPPPPPQGVIQLPPPPPPQGVPLHSLPPPQEDKPPPQGSILPLEQQENEATVLQHPLTMMISGPTGSF